MVVLAAVAFILLVRDSRQQYGAVAFGVFPAFRAIDSRGEVFDQHRLHGQLSAIIVADRAPSPDILLYLRKLSQATSHGTKYLNGLVLARRSDGLCDQWVRYLTLNEADFERVNAWKEQGFKDGVILVDQNGVIRGVFDVAEKLERLNLEAAVKGIL